MTILPRQTQPAACCLPCLNTGTNNVSLGSCAATDDACLCRSTSYVQGVVNCLSYVSNLAPKPVSPFSRLTSLSLLQECSAHSDVVFCIQYSTSFCALAGVNTGAPGVTTPTAQIPTPAVGRGGAGGAGGPGGAPAGGPRRCGGGLVLCGMTGGVITHVG